MQTFVRRVLCFCDSTVALGESKKGEHAELIQVQDPCLSAAALRKDGKKRAGVALIVKTIYIL